MNIIHNSTQKFVPNPIFHLSPNLQHDYMHQTMQNYDNASIRSPTTHHQNIIENINQKSQPFLDKTNLLLNHNHNPQVKNTLPPHSSPNSIILQSNNTQQNSQSTSTSPNHETDSPRRLKHKKKVSPRKKNLQQLYNQFSEMDKKDCIFIENQLQSQHQQEEQLKNTQQSCQSTPKVKTHIKNDDTLKKSTTEESNQNSSSNQEENSPQKNEELLKMNKFNFLNNQLNLDSSSDEEDLSKQVKDPKGSSSSSENDQQKVDFMMPKIRSRKEFLIHKDNLNLQSSDDEQENQNQQKVKKQNPQQTDNPDEQQEDETEKSQPKTTSRSISIADFRRQFVNSDGEYLKKPLPEGVTIDLIIKRDKSKKNSDFVQYSLYDSKTLKMLVVVVKKSGVHEIMAKKNVQDPKAHPDVRYLTAKLQSNFLGNQFNLKYIPKISRQPNKSLQAQQKEQIAATVCYETNILGLKGPRKMSIYIPENEQVKYYGEKTLEHLYNKKWYNKIQKFVNKQAKWNNEVQSYVLNLKGKARLSSVKNFVIVRDKKDLQGKNIQQDERSYVIFGKISKEIFNLSISGPFSIIQGLSLALSTFERKLICQ